MIKTRQKLFLISFLAVFGILTGLSVQAAGVWTNDKANCVNVISADNCGNRIGGYTICCDALVGANSGAGKQVLSAQQGPALTALQDLPDPMGVGGATSVSSQAAAQTVIARLINYVLGFIGSIALIMFIYGGITWMTAAGSADKVKKGKNIIVWSALGLAVIFMAYIAVRFVVESLTM